MQPTSLLFLHSTYADKNYSEEFELRSIRMPSWDISTVLSICTPISVLGSIGNGIVFWLLCCTIKKTKFTLYVANLAVADFVTILHLLISFLKYFKPHYISTGMTQLMVIMFLFGHGTNSFFLTAMSTERCLSVLSPVWYESLRGKCRTYFVCALLWTLSLTLTVLDHFLCSPRYIYILKIGNRPCKVVTIFQNIVYFIILYPTMLFSTLALFIRIKRKPQQNLPARLDISILATVVVHLILYPVTEMAGWIIYSRPYAYVLDFYYLTIIFSCVGRCVNPFIYLLVGSWKAKKYQEPFYMFLERALRNGGKGRGRTQPDQEKA